MVRGLCAKLWKGLLLKKKDFCEWHLFLVPHIFTFKTIFILKLVKLLRNSFNTRSGKYFMCGDNTLPTKTWSKRSGTTHMQNYFTYSCWSFSFSWRWTESASFWKVRCQWIRHHEWQETEQTWDHILAINRTVQDRRNKEHGDELKNRENSGRGSEELVFQEENPRVFPLFS